MLLIRNNNIMENDLELKEIWSSHGFVSSDKLFQIVKAKGLTNYKLADIKSFIESQEVSQLHKQVPKKTAETPITADGKNNEAQMDLLDMSSFSAHNRGHNWIFVVEDIWSRRAAALPIKTKSPRDVLPALKACIAELGKPVQVVSDSGTEFRGAVEFWLKEEGISQRMVDVGDHRSLGIIDRLAKTIKNALHKKFTHTQNRNWIDYLPTLIKSYNNTPHSAFKTPGEEALSPAQANVMETDTRNIHLQKVYNAEDKRKPTQLAVGDYVRVLKKKELFQRGYSIRYSKEVFTIDKIDGLWIELSNGKKYKEASLQKVKAPKSVDEPKSVDMQPAFVDDGEQKEEANQRKPLAPGRARSPTPERVIEKTAQGRIDVGRLARFDHRSNQIVKHREGLDVSNRRVGLRTRKPVAQVEDDEYGRVLW